MKTLLRVPFVQVAVARSHHCWCIVRHAMSYPQERVGQDQPIQLVCRFRGHLVANNRKAKILCSFAGIETRLWAHPCRVSTSSSSSSPSEFQHDLKNVAFSTRIHSKLRDRCYATLCIFVDSCVRCCSLASFACPFSS